MTQSTDQLKEIKDDLNHPAFEQFLGKLNLGLALHSSQGHFYYVSQSLTQILGFAQEVVYQKGPDLIKEITTPHDKPLVEQLLKIVEAEFNQINGSVTFPRISFDYHIQSGAGNTKRIYQHLLPNAVRNGATFYSLFILHDFTGFKKSSSLHYHISYLGPDDKFVTRASGRVSQPCPYTFTRSEKKLLHLLVKGKSMKEIAHEQKISLPTLKRHRSNILNKAADKNMVALLHEGLQQGWLENEV